MKVYLVRHGIAQDRLGGAVLNDSQRPLTDEGKDETKAVAQGLRRLNVRPDLCISSPLIRAKQTAEIMADVLGTAEPLKILDSLCPGGAPPEIFKQLKTISRVNEVLIVG
ncbi:MAG TPA: histidine phosphatase family protein, partial [Chroococcales cyanobacterium]